jgi:hypothetical protein
VPNTVTEADDGENGPASASDRLVAMNAGKRGSIGVSNSPLAGPLPAGTGSTPSAAGASTAGISSTRGSRHGMSWTVRPTVIRPRQASAKSSTACPTSYPGTEPQLSRRPVGSSVGASASGAVTNLRSGRGIGTTGRPTAAAISRWVVWPSAATSTLPEGKPGSSSACTRTRSTSWACTT